jgi:hypothetical protein
MLWHLVADFSHERLPLSVKVLTNVRGKTRTGFFGSLCVSKRD